MRSTHQGTKGNFIEFGFGFKLSRLEGHAIEDEANRTISKAELPQKGSSSNVRSGGVVCEIWPNLFAGEAFEVGHLAFHFLACGVGSGPDALNAQAELVRIGRAGE